jgi:O-antigen biosynthesis protein
MARIGDMRTLQEIYNKPRISKRSDKGTVHSYLGIYDKIFSKRRRDPISLLEIGIYEAGSLILWHKYFTNGRIAGVDISQEAIIKAQNMINRGILNKNRIEIYQGNSTAQEDMQVIPGEFDIIIDDGSHKREDQLQTLQVLAHRLKRDGIYIIEDIYYLKRDQPLFEGAAKALNLSLKIIDLRKIKRRSDDALLIFTH